MEDGLRLLHRSSIVAATKVLGWGPYPLGCPKILTVAHMVVVREAHMSTS